MCCLNAAVASRVQADLLAVLSAGQRRPPLVSPASVSQNCCSPADKQPSESGDSRSQLVRVYIYMRVARETLYSGAGRASVVGRLLAGSLEL